MAKYLPKTKTKMNHFAVCAMAIKSWVTRRRGAKVEVEVLRTLLADLLCFADMSLQAHEVDRDDA